MWLSYKHLITFKRQWNCKGIMFLLAHLRHCFSVLSLSKFIFNIRFQIAVLVCSIDTERNKNKQGDARSGTACLLEIFFIYFNSTYFMWGYKYSYPKSWASTVCSPAMPDHFPYFPVVEFHTFLEPQLCVGASSLKIGWQIFYSEKWENFCYWSLGREGLRGFSH